MSVSIFEVMSRLAAEHGAINLGQGFPDDRGPEDVLELAARALLESSNQYPSMRGTAELRQAVALHERRFYGLDFDWQSEVLITSGATEALAACILAFVRPGDEVVLFQPCYDAYAPLVRRAGGIPRFITLGPPDWRLEEEALAAAFTGRIRLVLLNNPLNPAGKVFDAGELDLLARFVEESDAVVVADEVYEHLVFSGATHLPFIARPGMARRTLKIGSAGKTFSLTGWKVGMVVGAAEMVEPVARTHQFLTFCTPPNLQTAVAYGLRKDDDYFKGLAREMERRRDRLADGLRSIGWKVLPTQGTYFLNVEVDSDVDFCRHLVEKVGVAAIPLSAFYEASPVTTLARFCFAKKDAVIDAALERLR